MRDFLHGRRALVTGGTRGIGMVTAQQLSKRGAGVVLTGRDENEAARIARQIVEQTGGTVHGVGWNADAADDDSAAMLVDSAIGLLGTIDIVVNNAGMINRGPALSVTTADWDRLIRVNLSAPFTVSKAAAIRMNGAGSSST